MGEGEFFFLKHFVQLADLLETIHHNIPSPLGNVTQLLREAGLQAMADKADRQFFEEGKELENLRTDRSDCQTDDCIAKLDLREQKIEEEREHRLSLLRQALGRVVEREVTIAPSDFPERTLLIVLMVLLAVMVLGLLVLAIALAGYWAKSSKKKEPARLERRPSSEWEWREY